MTETQLEATWQPKQQVIPEDHAPADVAVVPHATNEPIQSPSVSPPIEYQSKPKRDSTRVQYTRQQLYEAIWSTPCQKLAASLGVSDVALAKTCRRLGIPRPSLGYWAKREAGQTPPKTKLPPASSGQDRTMMFDVAANLNRRKEWATSQSHSEELAVDLELTGEDVPLHPLAQKHKDALEKLKPGEDGYVRIDKKELFRCEVTPQNVDRLCRALHAIFAELEARGYKFKASKEDYGNLHTVRGDDWVMVSCSETREEIVREPTAEEKRKPSWMWQLKKTEPTGRFAFEVHAPGLRGRRTWTEGANKRLEEVLGIVVEKVDATFKWIEEERQREVEADKRREEEERLRAERWAAEEKQRKERERLERHQKKVEDVAEARRENLRVAALQWCEAETVKAFVDLCEVQWKQAGELSKAQLDWLDWGRAEAVKLHPFAKGYPDPLRDGAFDPAAIKVGGPYPETRMLEEVQSTEPVEPPIRTVYVKTPQPYPFWIRHRKY